jgi:outer membrane lipoprotein carrier protein
MIDKQPNHIAWLFACLLMVSDSIAEQIADSKLQRLLTPIVALSANFSQRSLNTDGEVTHEVKGNFQAMEPNKINWVIEQPMPQQIISNGTKLWIYDPDLAQVVIQPYRDTTQSNPISLLLDNPEKLTEHIDISYSHQQKTLIDTFLLKPKQTNALYTELQLEFIGAKPIGLRYLDNFGQITQIVFQDLVINPSLSKEDFIFKIPDDTDVVNHVR